MTQKELVIRLINDDLKHQSLLNNFESIGFYSDGYDLSLSDTIFKILEIEDENEELFELYLNKCTEIIKLWDYTDKKELKVFSTEVYNFLRNNIPDKH